MSGVLFIKIVIVFFIKRRLFVVLTAFLDRGEAFSKMVVHFIDQGNTFYGQGAFQDFDLTFH